AGPRGGAGRPVGAVEVVERDAIRGVADLPHAFHRGDALEDAEAERVLEFLRTEVAEDGSELSPATVDGAGRELRFDHLPAEVGDGGIVDGGELRIAGLRFPVPEGNLVLTERRRREVGV